MTDRVRVQVSPRDKPWRYLFGVMVGTALLADGGQVISITPHMEVRAA